MYDWHELRADWDHFWRLARVQLADKGLAGRADLIREKNPWRAWRSPDLLLGQTCGWPYSDRLSGQVAIAGRFDFGLQTRRPGDYFSAFVMRRGAGSMTLAQIGDLIRGPGIRLAVNDRDSQSGCRVFGSCLDRPLSVGNERVVLTGSHRQSIIAVADGVADIAAIDANSWAYAERTEPKAGAVAQVCRSPDMPGLPLITAKRFQHHAPAVREACAAAIAELPDGPRDRLLLKTVVEADPSDYLPLAGLPFSRFLLETG